jgi:hypothetical protein
VRLLSFLLVPVCASRAWPEDGQNTKPLSPTEAAKHVNEKVTVEMVVKATKDRLIKRQEIYLDSEENFRDPKNLGVIITKSGDEKLQKAGIKDPAAHFKSKTIQVTGTVIRKENRLRIEVDDPKQIRIVNKNR